MSRRRALFGQPMNTSESSIRESHLRSVLKAFTWRVVATTTTAVVAFIVTGKISTALTIGAWEFLVKLGVYYMHERLWQWIPRGTVRKAMHGPDSTR